MFNKNRYVTKGVSARIPAYLQNLLWYIVEILPEPKDHLQVFELMEHFEGEKVKQKIIHRQENPEYCQEHIISVKVAVSGKIYIIDDGNHSTMLMPEEY